MIATETVVLCSSCGGRLARDHSGTVCSPCQRTLIERSARRQVSIAREGPGIKAAFETSGLYGVAQYLECTPDEAINASLTILVSFTELLISLIGISLTRRLLASVWEETPTLVLKDYHKDHHHD